MNKQEISTKTYEKAAEFIRIGNEAVRKAQEKNRNLGIPNVYALNGHLLYELPDGTLTTEDPFDDTE